MDNCDLILNSFKLQGYTGVIRTRSWVSRHFWCFFRASSNFPSDSRTFPMFSSVVATRAEVRRSFITTTVREESQATAETGNARHKQNLNHVISAFMFLFITWT